MFAFRSRPGPAGGLRTRLRARLLVRALEALVEPTIFVVTNTSDGPVTAAGQLPGSLRQAIFDSNSNGQADTIIFDPSVTTINLTAGQLTISEKYNLTIDGGGTVTINGAATASATNRILNLTPTGSPTITIQGITLAKGNTLGDGGAIDGEFASTTAKLSLVNCSLHGSSVTEGGGAIYFTKGVLSVIDCTLDRNSAGLGNSGQAGGAIYLSGNVTATLNQCIVSGNSVVNSGYDLVGGGIYAGSCQINLTDCSIISNAAPAGYGGGLEVYQSVATLTNCTVAGNSAGNGLVGGSGGLDLFGNSTTTFTNCTIANNTAKGYGGGIWAEGPTVIRNCTISGNSADSSAGGIVLASNIQMDSSIIAANTVAKVLNDLGSGGHVFGNNNLFGVGNGVTVTGSNNQIGTSAKPLDPGLLPLGDYGGPTPTMALRYNSLAIGLGANPAGLPFDQRGQPRVSPNGLVDIGAVEGPVFVPFVSKVGLLPTISTAGGTSYTVAVTYDGPNGIDSTTLDGSDIVVAGPRMVGPITVSSVTITGNQAKVIYQFAPPDGSWDKFDFGTYSVSLAAGQVLDASGKSVPPQLLGKVQVNIAGPYVVDALGDQADGDYRPGRVTLREAVQYASSDGSPQDTITFDPAIFGTPRTIELASQLNVSNSIIINGPGFGLLTLSGNNRLFFGGSITLSGLTLTGGNVLGSGGTIYASSLTATDCTFGDNTATTGGGAIYTSSALTLTRCTIVNNKASGDGGAVYASSLTATDCTFEDNTATTGGGAIYASSALTLIRCTVVNNMASSGGGVYAAGTLTLAQSTVTGNMASQGGGIYAYRGSLSLDNCTVSGNKASSVGGGIYFTLNTTVAIRNSTITSNSATTSGGGVHGSHGGSASIGLTLSNTIIAGNVNAKAPDLSFNKSQYVAGNNNLIGVANVGGATFSGTNNLLGTLASPLNAKLAPLGNYGGPTLTHALLPGSPAINAGAPIAGITTDQRGYARTYGSAPDIGAYELQPPRVNSVVINDGSAQRSRVTSVTVNFDSLVAVMPGAFQLQRQSDGKLVEVFPDFSVGGPTTSVTLSFSGALTEFGSLKDGRYSLTVFGTRVSNFVGSLDGNGDSVPGDDYVSASSGTAGIFRLFGDVNGDGTVAANDLVAFRQYFGGYLFAFDFDGDGSVNASDFMQFRMRFGGSV
jgi:predicted outer membrane repeat protein